MKGQNIKPTKFWSVIIFFFGIVFALYGIFAVIPTYGVFGIVWTLTAAFIAVYGGVNLFSKKGIPLFKITFMDGETNETISDNHIACRLKAVKKLYKRGLISKDEYEKRCKQILEEIEL